MGLPALITKTHTKNFCLQRSEILAQEPFCLYIRDRLERSSYSLAYTAIDVLRQYFYGADVQGNVLQSLDDIERTLTTASTRAKKQVHITDYFTPGPIIQ